MKTVTLRSPAKLNLSLKVLRKRADGYHDLKTLFERISLSDEITFKANPDGNVRIRCAHPHVPCGPKNLIYRAAVLLRERCRVRAGVDVILNKRIPVAAGLAGGSSNAATTLKGLNALWKLRLSRAEMVALARELGSDVPFFLHDCSWALGTSRGDEIQSLDLKTKLWHILVVPRLKMYSTEVFANLNLQLTKTRDDVNILIRYLKDKNIIRVGSLLYNDLESSILELRSSLRRIKERLLIYKEVEGVSFSGSGPAIFGITQTQQQAEELQTLLSRRYSQVYAVRTL